MSNDRAEAEPGRRTHTLPLAMQALRDAISGRLIRMLYILLGFNDEIIRVFLKPDCGADTIIGYRFWGNLRGQITYSEICLGNIIVEIRDKRRRFYESDLATQNLKFLKLLAQGAHAFWAVVNSGEEGKEVWPFFALPSVASE